MPHYICAVPSAWWCDMTMIHCISNDVIYFSFVYYSLVFLSCRFFLLSLRLLHFVYIVARNRPDIGHVTRLLWPGVSACRTWRCHPRLVSVRGRRRVLCACVLAHALRCCPASQSRACKSRSTCAGRVSRSAWPSFRCRRFIGLKSALGERLATHGWPRYDNVIITLLRYHNVICGKW